MSKYESFEVYKKWIFVYYIVKDVEIGDSEVDDMLLESKLNNADTIIMTKRILRDRIYALNDARPSSRDMFDRDDVYVLDTADYGTIHIIMREEEIPAFLDSVGPDYDKDNEL